jgi:hypothetical protein
MLMYGAIPQYDGYHAFADTRMVFSVPNAMDVLSNMAFGLTGLIGLGLALVSFGRRSRQVALLELSKLSEVSGVETTNRWQAKDIAYLVFTLSIFVTSFGSAFYHWAPDDGRLFWDRLPIAFACASLLAAVHIEAKNIRQISLAIVYVFTMLLLALISVLWWRHNGDLRLYLALQLLAILLIPLWQTIYPTASQTRIIFAIAVGLYVVAKIAESLDAVILTYTGFISGHTIKHLLASAAAALIIWNWLSATSALKK